MFSEDLKGHPARPSRGIRPLSLFLLFSLIAGLTGCGGCSSGTSTTSSTQNDRLPTSGRDLLDPAITMMQPDRLGIEANPEQPTGLLNQWRAVQMKTAEKERLSEPLSEETRKLLESDLSADAVKRAERDDFTEDDAKHIRTAMLMKAIVDHVAKGVDGELNRAQVVFDYVTRNVQLVSEEEALPLTPYEMLIFGEGTAADRAWIFAELLRQLNQDAVIVRPRIPRADGIPGPWFVGAVAKQEIRLFDPLRSTPVPTTLRANGEDILPASLADLSDPRVLESLTGGTEKDLSPGMFGEVRLEVIGTSTLWAPRLANLQKVLTGEASVVISQKLTAAPGDSASLINRIASLQNVTADREELRLWSHPENRLREFEELETLNDRWKPFEAPQHIAVDPQTGNVTFGSFSRLQLKTRTEQLKGQLKAAIQGYLRVQLAHRHMGAQLPGELRELHADAAEDAFFWTAVCQMEQGAFDEAANKFGSYVQQAERFIGSRRDDHARILLARCLIQLGQPAKAIEALKPLGPASPEHETAMFLQHALKNAEEPASPAGTSQSENPQPEESPSPRPDPQKPNRNQPAIAEKPAG